MERSKFCYIVGACSKYIPELCAMLNSLDSVGNRQDVHVIGLHLPEEFTSQFDKVDYTVVYHNIPQEEIDESRGISEVTCRKRYWYAGEIGKDYDAVCILDADLIWVRDPKLYFEIAAKTGFILGPCKEQNKIYNDDHHLVDGKWIWNVPRGYYNDKDLCNCPVFLDAKIWGDALKMSWDIFINRGFRAPDMDAMSLSFLHYGSHDKTILLAGNQWLGTNEQHLKPYIRVIENHGKIQTESGIPVFSYHGHIGHVKWRETQLENRHHCIQGYLKATDESLLSSDNIARGSMDLLYSRFKKMFHYNIKIEPLNYRHQDKNHKDTYGDLWEV